MKLRNLFKYRNHLAEFQKKGGVVDKKFPIYSDFDDQAGIASGHYFHQDLLIASYIFNNQPKRHIDIGSRIDGFVAHVAAFRTIEVLDIRPLKPTVHENIKFIQANLMSESAALPVVDSISCLHAIEHFGLGRYGDPIDPQGYKKGFKNILKMLAPGGTLYISFPIGTKNEVHFNAHRIFAPNDIFSWAPNDLKLERFDYVDDDGNLHKNIDLNVESLHLNYGCGIYTFKRNI
jgi:Caenorhabditis protein of unknown function, DUF268